MARFYDGNTKKMMKMSGALIHEDRNAPCNLPMDVVSKDFPQAEYGLPGGIDDLFDGAQKQMGQDTRELAKAYKPGKY